VIAILVSMLLWTTWKTGAKKGTPHRGDKLICALTGWYCSEGSDFKISANVRIQQLSKSLRTKWKKNDKIPRIPLLDNHIDTIISSHPHKAKRQHWKAYVVLAWVFLLRHGETSSAKPTHLTTYKDEKGNKKWALFIPIGKTSIGPNDPQNVAFHEDDIPLKYLPYLMWFSGKASDKSFKWQVGRPEDHIRHVRSALQIPAMDNAQVCFHCTRHGCAAWLTSMTSTPLQISWE